MTRSLLAVLLLATTALPALGQPVPFDMSPESRLVVPAPQPPVRQPNAAPPVAVPVPQAKFERFLLPEASLRLEGEENRHAVVVYLTGEQAAAPARLELSYLNALVVAPEVSTLGIRINGTQVAGQAIGASASASAIGIDVPPGLLRPGANLVEFRATQRHRTDCSVASTYELWTEMQSPEMRLVFDAPANGRVTQLADLAAIGVDAQGNTTIRVLRSQMNAPEAMSAMVQLAQQLAIALRVADLNIEMVDTLSTGYLPGVLDVAIMPAGALPRSLATAQAQAAAGPLAAMVPQANGANLLLVSGPDWSAVRRAGDALLAAAPLSADAPRIDLPTPHPMMLGGQSIAVSDLGVETIEFNGRRYQTQLQFELPYDFYAYRYGELELVLDAAYSNDVLPGSEIDIYTNGQIASATPLLRTDGGMLRDTVIRIPMTNLRPGRNEVTVAVNLLARSDAVCSAGWTGQAPARFVLSNTSQLRLPQYARAAAMPDLLVTAGSGWPYAGGEAVPVAIGSSGDALVSAMLMLSRIAAAAGTALPVAVVPPGDLRADRNSIVVMPLGEMPPQVLSGSGVASVSASSAASDESVLNQFNNEPTSTPLSGPVDWLLASVGLQLNDLRVVPEADTAYAAAPGATVMSQVRRPEGGIWTVLTAADAQTLRTGTQDLVVTDKWRQVSGRISAVEPGENALTVLQTNNPTVIETQPRSFANLRLIAANWFSGNLLYFAATMAAAAIILMLASSFVLNQLGRRK